MRKRILAVDDDPTNREVIGEILGPDYELDFACDGLEALELAARRRPDLVVLDIMMPHLDGYETCARLKAADPFVKVLLVSANALPAERLRGYQVGADDYVARPFDPYEFLAKVQVFLRLGSVEEIGQMKSNLITLLDHETRTPLAHILSSAQLLQDERSPESAEERRDLLRIVVGGAQRLQNLFEKSMILFRQQSATEPPASRDLELGALIRSEIDRLRTRFPGVRIRFDGSSEAVCAEETLLRQALGTLLELAARRSPSGCPIAVRLRRLGPQLEIAVEDRGPAPDAETLDHFFDLFAVGDLEHHSETIDLDRPICASIVRRHGGTVEASVPPDGGLVCRLVLPAGVPGSAAA